jgi:hypothetical protein
LRSAHTVSLLTFFLLSILDANSLTLSQGRRQAAIAGGYTAEVVAEHSSGTSSDGDAVEELSRGANSHTLLLPTDHRLLVVVHHNTFRGLLDTMLCFGLTVGVMAMKDSVSRFSESEGEGEWWRVLPEGLMPTRLQVARRHHPWVDLLPSARLRDNVLRIVEEGEMADEDELCEDVAGVGKLQAGGGGPGLILWGEPWEVGSWEVGIGFWRKWGRVLGDCWELVEATNRWREFRGEERLVLGEGGVVAVSDVS